MARQITTDDGYTLTVHATMYVDWGISIDKGGRNLFYGPCHLSAESYGRKPHPRFDGDYDAAEAWELEATPRQQSRRPAFVPWTDADWRERLREEADDLIDAYVPVESHGT